MITLGVVFTLSVFELFLLGAHLNVVFYIFSKPLKPKNFERNQWFFYFDGVVPVINTLILRLHLQIHSFVYYYILGHLILHLVYAIPWNSRPIYVKEIITWSCSSLDDRLMDREHYGKLIGTLYDVFSHTIMFMLDFYLIFKFLAADVATLVLIMSFLFSFGLLLVFYSHLLAEEKVKHK